MEPRLSYISPSLNEEALQHAIAYKLMFILGKDPSLANKHEWLNATLFAVRDRLVERWLRAHRARISQQARQVYWHCCKVSDEAAFCLIQRPYISKTLLTRRISPRGSP